MNKKILSIILAATLVALSSCKDDKEDDGTTITTTTGLYINEVASQPNPDKIELYNSTDKVIDLSGYVIQDDKGAAEEWIIPNGTKIAAKGFILFTNGVDFLFGLSSGGDKVILFSNSGVKIDEIAIPAMTGGSYTRTTDGGSAWVYNSDKHTLGVSNGSTPTTPEEPETPTPDPTADFSKLKLNEIASQATDWIEIYNAGDVAIDLSGCVLQDAKGAAEETVIGSGKTVPARGVLVLEGEGADFGFGLSSGGDDVALFSPDRTQLDKVSIPAMVAGDSYARSIDGAGSWAKINPPTKGAKN